jgi:ADP-L-glycero-D-manno-heptose 6-epimerase
MKLPQMQESDVIVITGAAGFIGSFLAGQLNSMGYHQLVLVDDFSRADKLQNFVTKKYKELVDREVFFDWVKANGDTVKFVFHLGARTDTTEMDYEVHRKWNLNYSIQVWQWCSAAQIPLVYASSAATYGNGELGYSDSHTIVNKLHPLNPYGVSKNEFDIWALAQASHPPFWAGLKFFNVYGPNEYHKGRMASVILHAYGTIKETGAVKLFRSHNPDYKDGEQLRDFIYVRDIAAICVWLMDNRPESGLYNAGTGQARTFNDLVNAIFSALSLHPNITYIDTPIDIRDKYQYFTEADMSKLKNAGYSRPFYTLESGVADYLNHFLIDKKYF